MSQAIQTPESSNIASYAYAPARSAFIVEYKDKDGNVTATWEYAMVPPKIFDEARAAESIGKFIRSRVVGYYDGKKVS